MKITAADRAKVIRALAEARKVATCDGAWSSEGQMIVASAIMARSKP